MKRLAYLTPLALFAGALVLRFWALDWGMPTAQHIDEPAQLEVAVRMLRDGTLNPHQFVYPSLPYELFALAIRLSVWWSNLRGHPFAVLDLPLYNSRYTTAPMIFVWSRGVTALLGAATVPALWALGRRMFDWRIGLLAALLLMVSQFHVRYSHYVTTDAPTGLWVTLALLGAWRVATNGDWRGYLLAGAGVGLSAGYKYNAAIVALAVVLAHVFYWRRALLSRSLLRLCASGVVALLVLVATMPYAVLEWPAFLDALRANSESYATSSRGDFNGHWQIGGYALWIWNSGLFAPACFVTLAGLPIVIWHHRRASALLLLTIAAEMLLLLPYRVHYLRNVLPVYPLVILLAAASAIALADLLHERIGRVPGAAPAVVNSGRIDGGMRQIGTIGAAVSVALAVVIMLPHVEGTVWRLRYWSKPYTMVDAMARVRQLPRGMRVAAEVQPVIVGADVNVDVVDRLTERSLDWYRANGYRYLITNEDRRTADEADAYAKLVAGSQVLTEYPPRRAGLQVGPGGAVLDLGEHLTAMRFVRHEMVFGEQVELLGYEIRPGPQRSVWTTLDGAATREIPSGQPVQINLYFRALARMDRDYMLFVHVLGQQGQRVAQRDLPARNDDYPTSHWRPGELVLDRADLSLPALPPGQYRFDIGFYDAATGERLPVQSAAASADRAQELLTVTVRPATAGALSPSPVTGLSSLHPHRRRPD